jgi:hypothetical protein
VTRLSLLALVAFAAGVAGLAACDGGTEAGPAPERERVQTKAEPRKASGPGPTPLGPGSALVACADRVEPVTGTGAPLPIRPPQVRSGDVQVGPAIFFGLGKAATDQPISRANGLAAYKSGITVRAGAPVTVSIPRPYRRRVALDYGWGVWPRPGRGFPRSLDQGRHRLVFRACSPRTPRFTDGEPIGPWTGWAGGFIVAGRGCAEIEVRVGGSPQTVRRHIGFGRRSCSRRASPRR